MENYSYEAIFYDKPNGTVPAKDFLISLDVKMRAKMTKTINVIK